MNTSALSQQNNLSNSCKLPNSYRFIRLSFSVPSLSIDTIKDQLTFNQYNVLADLSASSLEGHYHLLIEAEVSALDLPVISKWFIKRVKSEFVHSKLENKSGEIIAECKLYCDGNSSF